MVNIASRLNDIGEYYFSAKLREIESLNRAGHAVINLGIGSPDLPPHPSVIEALHAAAQQANTHAYQSYKGSPVLREAIANWYKKWYQVVVDPQTEVLPLIGSKEGIMHICMTFIDEGDAALVPNPGYPTYTSAVKLAGGRVLGYRLRDTDHWQPNLHQLRQEIDAYHASQKGRVKLLFLNYPHMPTGQLPSSKLMEELVGLAKEKDLLIVHDNPYSFILNDQPASLFQFDDKKQVVIELNSLSKSHNMAGWRVGMITASAEHVDAILRFKSNMDSGMFLPVQLAAAKALELGQDWFDGINHVYAARKEQACGLLDLLDCSYEQDQVGMFVWARIPSRYANGFQLSDEVLAGAKVFITPGGIFGDAGDQFVRVSLCSKQELLQEAIERIKAAFGYEKI